MRSSLIRGRMAKAFLSVAAAALLAGCSNSIERFQAAYNNPSDADPVYTASVPKAKKRVVAPRVVEPTFDTTADDVIEETPVRRAAIPMAKPKDYASAYAKPAYKQPTLKAQKPKLVLPADDEQVADVDTPAEEYVAPTAVKAPFKRAVAAKPKLVEAPEEQVAAVEPVAPKKIKFNQVKPRAEEPVEEEVAVAEPVVAKPAKRGAAHTVQSGETLFALGRKYGVSPYAIAEANGLDKDKQLAVGQQVKIPGAMQAKQATATEEVAEIEPAPKPKAIKIATKKAPLSLTEEQQADADAADGETAIGEAPKKAVAEVKPKVQERVVADVPASPTGLNLRWPVKGKVLSGYGNKPGGLKNEGINISVPEGTSIRAADSGVVAYAGNELKGYGNLVLIRHAGGYVTAYAHAKNLVVKRGDKVERGGVIGTAGQTGSVSSPQLHFEVRKGATALDPIKYLTSTTASN
jgi:murein DD-endopeptidase MepM/ murein hydrolase activator NlpD